MDDEERFKSEKKLIGNPDAKVWAEQFVRIAKKDPNIATDEETMIGWFANAIMAGYDKANNKNSAEIGMRRLIVLE